MAGNRIQRVLGVTAANRASHNDSTTAPYEPTMKLAKDYGVSVFPNPASTHINVVSNKIPDGETATLILYDNLGKMLLTIKNVKQQEEIPLSGYKAGIYNIALIISDKDKLYYKIIKEY
mgnify:FL=1